MKELDVDLEQGNSLKILGSQKKRGPGTTLKFL
jgi:hypothetical protein